MNRRRWSAVAGLLVAGGVILSWTTASLAQSDATPPADKPARVTPQQRREAAARYMTARASVLARQASEVAAGGDQSARAEATPAMAMPGPAAVPHYFGPYPNYANSPLPSGPVTDITVDNGGSGYSANPTVMIMDVYEVGTGATATASVVGGVITGITVTNGGSGYYAPIVVIDDPTGVDAAATARIGGPLQGGMRKFVDTLPGLNAAGANNLGQYIPVAIPDTTTYPGCDYYEIELGQYSQQLHSDLPATLLRGYRQTNTSDPSVSQFHYLGPLIVANRDRPVRIKFTNKLPTGAGGDLFLPVDTSVMGAGMAPNGEMYTQNRATLHLHGGFVPWISDGTPHQWTTPAGETTSYPKGVSVQNVPDMPAAGPGSLTFYYNNQQSARLMFYHDHAYGITRLNVYAGEAAGYVITDQVEQDLINGTNVSGVNPGAAKVLPDLGIPLIIQDKTFVDANTIGFQDPNWRWGSMPGMAMTGDLWLPSVFMPAQNPYDLSGANAFGRWQYGPWFWPPTTGITHGPVANEYYDPVNAPWEPPMRPDTPNPSMGMEAFMDTPLVNGTAYPSLTVEPKAYRFRILNAANDRFWNLQFYQAEPLTVSLTSKGSGYSSSPTVTFTGGGATTPATAVATVTGGVSSVVLTSGGAGYTSAPTVNLVGGGGTGATAVAAVATGGISKVQVTSGGIGYTSAPAVNFVGGTPTTPASATAVIAGRVDTVTLDSPGTNYTSGATVDFVGGNPTTPATATLDVSGGVSSVAVTSGGSGYTSVPTVAFVGGGATTPATGVATLTASVTAVTVTNGGNNYSATPTVAFTGGGATTPATAVAVVSSGVSAITVTNRGRNYTSAPTVTISGGGGSGATAVASISGGRVNSITVTNPGSGYTSAPTVTITGGGGRNATAVASIARRVTAINVTNPGAGYTSAPTVTITDSTGTGAAATASIASFVASVTVTNPGAGYTSAPAVTFTGGGAATQATATATVTGVVTGITLTSPGAGYTSAPTVVITDSTGTGAAATATITSAVVAVNVSNPGAGYTSVPAVTFTGGGATTPATATASLGSVVTGITVTNPGAGYSSAPTVAIAGGGATTPATAVAIVTGEVTGITVLDPGVGYTSAPDVTISGGGGTGAAALASVNTEVKMVPAVKTPGFPATWSIDGREGGVPDPATAGPAWIQIGTEGGFLPAPVVVPNQPVNWNMNATAFNVGNVTDHSLLLGCAERADVIVDFTPYAGKTLILYNDAPAAFPALDPRYDYYTNNPDQTSSGGTPPTLAGYGPNTRTVMQIRVAGTPVASAPTNYYNQATLDALKTAFAKTSTKRGVFEASQDPILVPQATYGSAYNTTTFPGDWTAYARLFDTSMTFTPIGQTAPVTVPFQRKAIHDEMGAAYDTEYGRMSGNLGLELATTNNLTQNFLLYGYASPPVDILQDSMAPLGTLGDGTQIWMITHNGVDTHPVHFHLVNVQLINRVAWDGALLPPEPNELGWKETVRVNPLEHTIVAMRPKAPTQPFDIPNSVRLIDPTMPEGAPLMTPPGGFVDPTAQPVTVTNHYVNFGWEYVWHCHILSHEEMDMMHSLCFTTKPKAPSSLTVSVTGSGATRQANLAWTDNSANESGFTIQRATNSSFTNNLATFSVGANVSTYVDPIGSTSQAYYYRVLAVNVVGDTAQYAAPAVGFPTVSLESAFTNTVTVAASGLPPAAPTNLRAAQVRATTVTLSWSDRSNNEQGFYIEQSNDNGATWTRIGQTSANSTSFRVNGLTTQTTYQFQVQAYNANGVSAYAGPLTVTTR